MGCQISLEVIFPRNSYFPASHIFREVAFSGKWHFPGSQNYLEVTITGKSHVPGSQQSPNVTNLTIGLRRRRRKTTCWPAALVANGLAAGKNKSRKGSFFIFQLEPPSISQDYSANQEDRIKKRGKNKSLWYRIRETQRSRAYGRWCLISPVFCPQISLTRMK